MSFKKIGNKRNCLRTHFKEKGEKNLRYIKLHKNCTENQQQQGLWGDDGVTMISVQIM